MTTTDYPRCAACGKTDLGRDLPYECPRCGERAIVLSPRGQNDYDEYRLRDEGKI